MDFVSALFKTLCEDLQPYDPRPVSDILNAPCELDVQQVAASILKETFLKKFEPAVRTQDLASIAIEQFLHCNQVCRHWSPPSDRTLINHMRNLAYDDFSDLPDWDVLLDLGRNGPGASVGSRSANSAFEKLFLNQHTYADTALYGSYRMWAFRDSRWLKADVDRRRRVMAPNLLVRGSHLGTVPKNDMVDRTICTEPSINMYFQLALGEYINLTLKSHGYDPAVQPDRNRELARIGSLDGRNSTIDLTSASDSISLSFCEYILPPTLMAAIHDCRCKETKLPDGSWVEMFMVSSMGNGFTFPLETYIFSLVLRALNLQPFRRGCGVFGDDIICPTSYHKRVCSLIHDCGFAVNEKKSFSGFSFFRESCGGDYYNGRNVRGVYLRHLSSIQDRYSILNRLRRWCAFHSIPLERTLQLLLPPNWARHQIPFDCPDDAGVKVRVPTFPPKRGRYNYFVYSVKKKTIRIATEIALKRDFDNIEGFLVCFSAGLVTTALTRRTSVKTYVAAREWTPFWSNHYQYDERKLQFPGWLDLTIEG